MWSHNNGRKIRGLGIYDFFRALRMRSALT